MVNFNNFVLPWFSVCRSFQSDSEAISEIFNKVTVKDTEIKLNNFDKKIDHIHISIIMGLSSWSVELWKMLPSVQFPLPYSAVLRQGPGAQRQ